MSNYVRNAAWIVVTVLIVLGLAMVTITFALSDWDDPTYEVEYTQTFNDNGSSWLDEGGNCGDDGRTKSEGSSACSNYTDVATYTTGERVIRQIGIYAIGLVLIFVVIVISCSTFPQRNKTDETLQHSP